jgi:hypothetical protein
MQQVDTDLEHAHGLEVVNYVHRLHVRIYVKSRTTADIAWLMGPTPGTTTGLPDFSSTTHLVSLGLNGILYPTHKIQDRLYLMHSAY